MLLEPQVNAVYMKSVFTFGQKSHDLDVFESGEAHGALEALFGAFERREAEEGEGFHDGLVDPRGESCPPRSGKPVVDVVGGGGAGGGAAVAELGVEEEDEG